MANRNLFRSIAGRILPKKDTVNNAGVSAYKFSAEHALAQYTMTGCLNSTFYATAETQLDDLIGFANAVSPEFLAKVAVYVREQGYMKDAPALLCAILSVRAPGLLNDIFFRVIDNAKMLRNFVQIMRSGVVGRKSMGTLPKRLVLKWLEEKTDEDLFKASIGQSPSIADIIKMVHPKPSNKTREALYGYLLGKKGNYEDLPLIIQEYEMFKVGGTNEIPDLPFQFLTSQDLDENTWKNIACRAPWQMTRMNLNTFLRHGVFEDKKIVKLVAEKLANEKMIAKAKVFPYQLMTAYKFADNRLPYEIREALQDAMEISIGNIPSIQGKVYVLPDVSGSMTYASVTGRRKGSTSAVRCIDVAALVAASVLRKNPEAEVVPFEQDIVNISLNPRDSVMTNAEKLAKIGGGGTNCSAPLAYLNRKKAIGDLVIFVSDNESWVDASGSRSTETMVEWAQFKKRNSNAKLVCLDIQPYRTTQAKESNDILNIGGFSDRVFDVISLFSAGGLNPEHWVGQIEEVRL